MKFELQPFNRDVPDERLLQDLLSAQLKLQAAGKNLTFRTYNEIGTFSASPQSITASAPGMMHCDGPG